MVRRRRVDPYWVSRSLAKNIKGGKEEEGEDRYGPDRAMSQTMRDHNAALRVFILVQGISLDEGCGNGAGIVTRFWGYPLTVDNQKGTTVFTVDI